MTFSSSLAGAVVVTGASTGIGRATALTLADAGYSVFAGVHRAADGEALRASAPGRLTPLILDVTDPASVAGAAREVAGAVGAGIAGLVNNAGIGVAEPMETVPSGDLRRQYDVNVFGQVTVIQAFLPLLRTGAGRMINIGSVGDRLTLPFTGPLTSSKWAFAAITEALRLEVRPWGIHVVLVEPALIGTEAVGKVEADSERVLERLRADGHTRYAAAYRATTRRALSREKAGSSPDVVARTVLRALSAPRPRTRYLVGKDAHLLAFLARWAPDRLFDLVRLRPFGLPAALGAAVGSDLPQPLHRAQ
ncbi:MAG TPA: SDR family NAD(P)-dependent oxidoreductase [Frankiaceae bacterium]|nr:SDR family NAD(P)-dependent oxidoreductase [Frankiaceae bacterium]